jgi:zinc protease
LDPASAFFAIAAVNPENVKKGQSAMLEEITKLVSTGINATDLAGAKKGIIEGFERNLSNDAAVLGMLSDSLYLGRTMEFWIKNNAKLKTLTADEVNATIKRRFHPTSLVKIVAGDKKKMGM